MDEYSSHIVINLFRITVESTLVVIVTLMIMFLVLSSWLI